MPDLFGVAVSPFELDEWQAATGIRPDLAMVFENWNRQRPLTDTLNKALSFNHNYFGLTWEPWAPTPVGSSPEEQGQPQSRWSHESILRGDHDAYIDTIARNLRDSKMTVYLRLMHEMNGGWYPWSNQPEKFVEAWKYIRYRMRSLRGAWNVKFVWSPNPDIWRSSPADWLKRLLPYWPGPAAVEFVGFTMLNFGGDRYYGVDQFAARYRLAREIFAKPVMAMETNVAHEVAVDWLHDLANYVRSPSRPLPLCVLSQGPSRGAATGQTGRMDWNAMDDSHCRGAIQDLVWALHS